MSTLEEGARRYREQRGRGTDDQATAAGSEQDCTAQPCTDTAIQRGALMRAARRGDRDAATALEQWHADHQSRDETA
jgi:hypothetical protein